MTDGRKTEALCFLGGSVRATEAATKDTIMRVSGYASTKEVDRYNTIIEPSAFNSTMGDYMKFPVLLVNHVWWDTPIGKIISYRIDETGLWIEAEIVNTERGREIVALIEAGILKSFSIGFNIVRLEMNWQDDNEPVRITEVQLIEISIVSSPGNMSALIDQAERKELSLRTFKATNHNHTTSTVGEEGKKGMNPEEVKKTMTEVVAPLEKKAGDTEVKVQELGKKTDSLSQMLSELRQWKETGERTDSEIRTLVDKISGEFEKKHEELSQEVTKLKHRKEVSKNALDLTGQNVRALIAHDPTELRANFTAQTADNIIHLQRLNDRCVMVDQLLMARSVNQNGDYHTKAKHIRMKDLSCFKDFSEFHRALDTATAGEGAEFVPTNLSGRLIELTRLEEKVGGLFEMIPMTSGTFEISVEGDDTDAKLIGEQKVVVAALDSNEETPGTGKVTFSAKKFRGRYQFSREETEDAIIQVMPYAERKIVRSIARSTDNAIINGQLTADIDTGYGGLATTDPRKAFNGLRYIGTQTLTLAVCGHDLSTPSDDGLRVLRSRLDTYGMYPEELVHLVSAKGYLMQLIRKLEGTLTLDKYGPNAVILSGEVQKHDNVPVVPSAFVQNNMNSGAIYDGTVTDLTAVITLNRTMFLLGVRRGLEVMTEYLPSHDVYNMYAYKRQDFQPANTPSSSKVFVAIGYNVPTTP